MEGGEAYQELDQTTQNNIGNQSNNFIDKVDISGDRKSKTMGAIIESSPRNDTHRALL
jgi:hypothetical protein